ncbi:MAG: stage III sporulation protein AC [Clostridiales bacterium]|nr:stage III sporulation protein AC [Clostridiales bacterium]
MNIDILFKIAAIGILITVLDKVLIKADREEIAMLVTLSGIVIVLLMVVKIIDDLFNNIKSIFRLY